MVAELAQTLEIPRGALEGITQWPIAFSAVYRKLVLARLQEQGR